MAGSARFFLIFLVKIAFVTISPETNPREPFRGAAHLLTDLLHGDIFSDLDNHFIVDVTDDRVAGECTHGVSKNVPADRLHDVLHKLRTIGFNPVPFLACVKALVQDRLPAELVAADLRFHVGKSSAGGKFYKQHSGFPVDGDAADGSRSVVPHSFFHGGIDLPPIADDLPITLPPEIHQRLQRVTRGGRDPALFYYERTVRRWHTQTAR